MNRMHKSIIVLGFVVITFMMECKKSPSAAEGIVGGGKLRYHAEAHVVPDDFQTMDGVWSFSIDGDGEGKYTISGSGMVTWIETNMSEICSWEATAVGMVTLTGIMSDCKLTFYITTVWNNAQVVRNNCPYDLGDLSFTQRTYQDVIGPFELKVGASSLVPPDLIWVGKAYVLDEIVINSESTMCKILQ